jgi:long-chain acyl-CoA synthetase
MNLAAVIEGHPADRPALIAAGAGGAGGAGGKVTTYGELRRLVGEARGGLATRGVGPGDRVAVVAANTPEFVVAYLAVLGVGALAVPLNPASPPPEVRRELDVVGAQLVVVGPGGKGTLAGVYAEAVTLDDLLGGPQADLIDRAGDDPAVLLFTSGTAGAPLAAVLTHGNLLANIEQIEASPGWAARPEAPRDVALGALPLFHVFGLNALLGVLLHAGGTVVLVERFDPEATLAAIAEHGVDLVTGAPAMWAALAEMPGADRSAVAGVRVALSGAAPLDPAVVQAVKDRLGLDLREGYGLTEASPVVASGLGVGAPEGSIGRPLPGVQVRLVDPQGEDVLVGDPGEIWVRGPNVFSGYWDDPEATGAALTDDGWLRTGDVAVVDDDGFLFVVDRIKDVVIVSGFNVFPAEVEAVLCEHPDVAEAAVVGVPDARAGEALRAFVVPRDGASIDVEAVAAHCSEHLARYKCPSSIEIVDRIPHGVAGKLLRRALK